MLSIRKKKYLDFFKAKIGVRGGCSDGFGIGNR
jgi:hypothetical protein